MGGGGGGCQTVIGDWRENLGTRKNLRETADEGQVNETNCEDDGENEKNLSSSPSLLLYGQRKFVFNT